LFLPSSTISMRVKSSLLPQAFNYSTFQELLILFTLKHTQKSSQKLKTLSRLNTNVSLRRHALNNASSTTNINSTLIHSLNILLTLRFW
jgi:hypothetical protein